MNPENAFVILIKWRDEYEMRTPDPLVMQTLCYINRDHNFPLRSSAAIDFQRSPVAALLCPKNKLSSSCGLLFGTKNF